jgi:hypothetical protein
MLPYHCSDDFPVSCPIFCGGSLVSRAIREPKQRKGVRFGVVGRGEDTPRTLAFPCERRGIPQKRRLREGSPTAMLMVRVWHGKKGWCSRKLVCACLRNAFYAQGTLGNKMEAGRMGCFLMTIINRKCVLPRDICSNKCPLFAGRGCRMALSKTFPIRRCFNRCRH